MGLTRRDLIKAGVFAGATLSLPLSRVVSGQSGLDNRMPSSKLPKPFTTPFRVPPVAVPVRVDDTTDYYEMTMRAFNAEVIPGFQTMLFGYESTVPGPTVKVQQGRQVVMRHNNLLPPVHPTLGYKPWTSVHLHGSASLPQYDGYASDITNPGEYKDYYYPDFQDGRTLWYHDHGVHHTAENAYHGLLAQYHLIDPREESLQIPQGVYDVPLVIGDALFNKDGSLLFTLEDESGLWGDVILVNGRPWPVMQVERRKYRFRMLGVGVSRSWRFSLDSGEPMAVVATDGGLMPTPQFVRNFRAASSERYEVIIDFAKYPIGRRVVLQNTSPTNNRDFANTNKIMAFDVVSDPTDLSNNSIPDVLNPDNPTMALKASDAVRTRRFEFERDGGQWTINGTTWENVIRSNYQFTPGEAESWRHRDLAVRELLGWVVPPRPRASHRLQDPRPQRSTTAASRARTERCRLRRRGREGAGDHAVGGQWTVHDALPQPDPRGPRHDVPVRGHRPEQPRRRSARRSRSSDIGPSREPAVNLTLAPLRAGRRTVAVDAAIVLSSFAALAHLVAAPPHYTWWPLAGVFFVVLGLAQLAYAGLLVRGAPSQWLVLAGLWGTVGVILLYVASRTVGIPMEPPVPFHGGRWVVGQSMVPNGAKYVGPLDLSTLVAEVLLVVTLLSMLPHTRKRSAVNALMWIGLALWSAAVVGYFW